jgi:hypothetical protein
MRKPRTDSTLDYLPDDQGEQLMEWILGRVPYRAIVTRMQEEYGVVTSIRALSAYWRKWGAEHWKARRQDARERPPPGKPDLRVVGGTEHDDRPELQIIAGKLPVLLAHPTSVAHGLNLQAGGRAVCWFGLTYNREEYDQLNARVYRQGQTRGVVIHRIIANGTIDAAIVDALGSKGTSQRAFIDSLRRLL